MNISPLAPLSYPVLPAIAGVSMAVGQTSIRYKSRDDLLLMQFMQGTQCAGVLTCSKVVAAPVIWCREVLTDQAASADLSARGLVVNAGNANAFTGGQGMASVEAVVDGTAGRLGCKSHEVFMASTGVIGEPLPHDKITGVLPQLVDALRPDAWHEAARAIMTTDTFMKVATAKTRIGDTEVTLNGFAKGSGMIAPNMATLLAFVFTDAAIPSSVLQELLNEANDVSFNSITVDGDTSTNDTLLAFATGQAKHPEVQSSNDSQLVAFKISFTELLTDLAIQVVKDGEGARKFITIEVAGAESDAAARRIAMTIANSPLVKTAVAGEDANWGRIVGAAGRAGAALAQEKIEVRIGGVLVAKDGARVQGFDETPVAAHMKGSNIHIALDLHLAQGHAKVYTCDLTHGYIDINGSYRS